MPAPDHCYNCDIPAIGKTQHGVPLCRRCYDDVKGDDVTEPAKLPQAPNVAWSTATWQGGPVPHSAACKCSRCSP